MESDPDNWSVDDVKRFFEENASKYINPKSKLPPLGPFLRALEDNDVNGHVLLNDVDIGFLRNDCNIASLGMRGSVLDCIRKLRQITESHQAGNDLPPQEQSVASHTPPVLPPPIASITSAGPKDSENVYAAHIRQGESTIEDSRGHKRRRLDLGQTIKHATASTSEITVPSVPTYLSGRKIPVDELFFGDTPIGAEVSHFVTNSNFIKENTVPDGEENFQFYSPTFAIGDSHYVHRHLRHFMLNNQQVEIERNGRAALMVLPYHDGAQGAKSVRSSMILSFKNGLASAYRQRAFHDDQSSTATGIGSSNEWDFLLEKYGASDSSQLLVPSASDLEDLQSLSPSLIAELEEEEDEEAQRYQTSRTMDKNSTSDVIDNYISDTIDTWKGKHLARLEGKRARIVWRQMKRSKTLRGSLLSVAALTVSNLQRRLEKYKRELLNEEWRNEMTLMESCRILDATIDDIEEQRWKMSVWRRNKEPHTLAQRYQHRGNGIVTSTNTTLAGKSSDVIMHDRISEEPAFPITQRDSNSEEMQLAVDDVGNEASDELSPGAATSDDEMLQTDHEDNSGFVVDDEVVELSPLPERTRVDVGILQSAVHTPLPSTIDNQVEEDYVSSDSLPSARELTSSLTKLKKEPITPVRITRRPDITPINLVSSDESTARKKTLKSTRTFQGAKAQPTGDPMDASADEIGSWNYDQLAKLQDGSRILIKAICDAGPELRHKVHQLQLSLFHQQLVDKLQVAIQAFKEGRDHAKDTSTDMAETLQRMARIAIAFWTKSPRPLEPDHDAQIRWDLVPDDRSQVAMFVLKLVSLCQRKDSRMFATDSARRKEFDHQSHPVVISSDNESQDTKEDSDTAEQHSTTPSKDKKGHRKRRVKESQEAQATRNSALRRQSKYQRALETQLGQQTGSSDAGVLLAMVDENQSTSSGILINPAKDDDEAPIYIHPHIAMQMKQHQVDGVRFMWRELTAEEDDHGCLLAHTMGLGKTMQTIALLATITMTARTPALSAQLPSHLRPAEVLQHERFFRILIVCPSSLVQNWRREIGMWTKGSFIGEVETVESTNWSMANLQSWYKFGGILLIGYHMLRSMLKSAPANEHLIRCREKFLLEDPEIVVADEAHNLKNDASATSQTASRFRTRSRIALTGTPMSNDVQEIYSLVSWIAPGYLGDKTEFSATYGRPIEQGTYKESTAYEKRKSLKKLAVLRQQIQPKVSRADITVLRGSLPPKVEYVITIPLTDLQVAAYRRFLKALKGLTEEADEASLGDQAAISQVQLFSWLALLGLLTAHPLCFKRKLLTPPPQRREPNNAGHGYGEGEVMPGDEHVFQLGFSEKAVNYVVAELTDSIDPQLSAKTSNLLAIVNLSRDAKDKLLVFSSSIPTLTYLGDLFASKSISFGRIDGSVPVAKRTAIIDDFHNEKFDVLLISTRAGGVGLNIQGANRVVIFDFGFNPTWEEQAVGRAYRLGQKKHVYVYRFVAGGTFETNIYNKQLFKSSLAQRVVDKKNPARNAERTAPDWLYEPREIPQKDLMQWVGKDAQVLDVMIERQAGGAEDFGIRTIQTMETLQGDAEDEPLTAEEREEVLREIEDSRNRVSLSKRIGVATQVPSSRPSASAPASAAGPSTANPSGPRLPSTAHARIGGS